MIQLRNWKGARYTVGDWRVVRDTVKKLDGSTSSSHG